MPKEFAYVTTNKSMAAIRRLSVRFSRAEAIEPERPIGDATSLGCFAAKPASLESNL
jgi:hypothetical protein